MAADYNSYEQELIMTFPVGTQIGEIGYDNGYGRGPGALFFDEKGFFYICDGWNDKVLVYDSNYHFLKEIFNIYSSKAKQVFAIDKKYFIDYSYNFSFSVDEFDGEKLFLINLSNSEYRNEIYYYPSFIFEKNIVFIYLKNGSIICIPNPGKDNDKNMQKILDNNTTKDLFESASDYDLDDLQIDGENRLFLNGELLTRNYKVFYNYWKDKHERLKYKNRNNKNIKSPQDFLNSGFVMTYLGKDKSNNFYWDANQAILIFNKEGWLIDGFISKNMKSKSIPTIHPSGDVYFLDYDQKGVYLYRVKNVWDPESRVKWYRESGVKDVQPKNHGSKNQTAIVTDSLLSVRKSSSLKGSVIGSLKKGDTVEILQRGFSKVTINGLIDYWYKIRRRYDGLEGWCFGGYLRLK